VSSCFLFLFGSVRLLCFFCGERNDDTIRRHRCSVPGPEAPGGAAPPTWLLSFRVTEGAAPRRSERERERGGHEAVAKRARARAVRDGCPAFYCRVVSSVRPDAERPLATRRAFLSRLCVRPLSRLDNKGSGARVRGATQLLPGPTARGERREGPVRDAKKKGRAGVAAQTSNASLSSARERDPRPTRYQHVSKQQATRFPRTTAFVSPSGTPRARNSAHGAAPAGLLLGARGKGLLPPGVRVSREALLRPWR
jgi:hypothetical protein